MYSDGLFVYPLTLDLYYNKEQQVNALVSQNMGHCIGHSLLIFIQTIPSIQSLKFYNVGHLLFRVLL